MENPQGGTTVKCPFLEEASTIESGQRHLLHDFTQGKSCLILVGWFVFGKPFFNHRSLIVSIIILMLSCFMLSPIQVSISLRLNLRKGSSSKRIFSRRNSLALFLLRKDNPDVVII